MLRKDQIEDCQSKFNLSYHVNYAKICQDLVGFENSDVLEVGGSLPPDFVFNYLGAKSWTAIEAPSYAESLEQASGLTHTGTIISRVQNPEELKFKNYQTDKYRFYLENIEDLPDEYSEQFDLIFSIATFEHIHKLPAALDKMFLALRPGGKLFSMFSPIWSAHDGHHLPEIKDSSGQKFNFGNSPIPPWGHLLMTRGEMTRYLYEKVDKETADKIVYFVYQSDHINRYFTEDYQFFIENSPFQTLKFDLTFKSSIPSDIEKELKFLYPRQSNFSNNGILLISEKSVGLSQQTSIKNQMQTSNSYQILSDRQFDNKSEWTLTTPVAFVIFNRPDTTARVFEAIRQAKPPKLLVIADGPRSDRPDDIENCQAARAIVEKIDWDCEIFRNYSEVNLGCRKRVISGLDWVFEQVEEAIILEDDCLPHPTFFRYCQELLEKYRNDTRIMMISGDNFQFGRNKTEHSYYFSRYGHIWGWATWRRSWSLFDESMQSWPELRDRKWLEQLLGSEQVAAFWTRIFQSVYEGFNTWDFIWQFIQWSHHGLVILPDSNLVSNIGFGSGTHTIHRDSPQANMEVIAMDFPLKHPSIIMQNLQADNFTEMTLFSRDSKTSSNIQLKQTFVKDLFVFFNEEKYELVLNKLDASSQSASNLYWKAIAEARSGFLNDAEQSLQHLLNHSPSNIKAQQLLKEINELSDAEANQMIDFRQKVKSRKSLISEFQGLSPVALTSPSGEITAQVDHLDHSEFKTVFHAFENDKIKDAFTLLNQKKARRESIQGLDYLRAVCFMRVGQPIAAIQSLYEELRYFPEHNQAQELLKSLVQRYPWYASTSIEDTEFQEIYKSIKPYTMLTEPRLYSLFTLAKTVCQEDIPGNFVECGVAAGGSTALLAAVIQRYTKQPRKVYAFDSFEGMPTPTEKDKSINGVPAEASGWGTGTCAAPEASLREICQHLDVNHIVQPVKGYFEDTLPGMHNRIGAIAFLHMDGDWYESTKAILENLYDRLSANAYIQADDYGTWEGCRQAIDEFFTQRQLQVELNKIDGVAVWLQFLNK